MYVFCPFNAFQRFFRNQLRKGLAKRFFHTQFRSHQHPVEQRVKIWHSRLKKKTCLCRVERCQRKTKKLEKEAKKFMQLTFFLLNLYLWILIGQTRYVKKLLTRLLPYGPKIQNGSGQSKCKTKNNIIPN